MCAYVGVQHAALRSSFGSQTELCAARLAAEEDRSGLRLTWQENCSLCKTSKEIQLRNLNKHIIVPLGK